MTRIQVTFLALILTQAAHSYEEYRGRLWEVFPPASALSGLVSSNLEQGFIIINVALAMFGLWCVLWPVRRMWPSGAVFVWLWIAIELVNGIGHPAWSIMQRGYTPGVATAPVLLVLALSLVHQLRSNARITSTVV
jgi:hypothetical protein